MVSKLVSQLFPLWAQKRKAAFKKMAKWYVWKVPCRIKDNSEKYNFIWHKKLKFLEKLFSGITTVLVDIERHS